MYRLLFQVALGSDILAPPRTALDPLPTVDVYITLGASPFTSCVHYTLPFSCHWLVIIVVGEMTDHLIVNLDSVKIEFAAS